jgi:polyisoprenoid-binding protein YceI
MNLLNHLKLRNALPTFVLVAALGVSGAAHAQVSTWTIDPAHSGIEFQIRHLGVSNVHGSFHKVVGTVKLDDADITHSSVEATIDATSVDTSEPKRDAHLKSPDFFNVDKFPTFSFKSTSVSKVDGKLKLTGELTLTGVTKPVTLDLDGPAAPQKGQNGKTLSGFSATGVLSRKDFNFGSKYGAPVLGDDVKFTIDIEMNK